MDEAKKRCTQCHPNTGAQCTREEGHPMPHHPAPLSYEQCQALCGTLMRDMSDVVNRWQSYGFDSGVIVGALFGAAFRYAVKFQMPSEEVRKLLDEAFVEMQVRMALEGAGLPMPVQNAPAPKGVQ